MTRAAATDAMPITKPVERTIPPEIMTKVCPNAIINTSAISAPIVWKL
jgi:hypothetical protein